MDFGVDGGDGLVAACCRAGSHWSALSAVSRITGACMRDGQVRTPPALRRHQHRDAEQPGQELLVVAGMAVALDRAISRLQRVKVGSGCARV
jgi:hypothetical protein